MLDMVCTRDKSLQDGLRDVWSCGTTLALAYVLCYAICLLYGHNFQCIEEVQNVISTDWCITVEY